MGKLVEEVREWNSPVVGAYLLWRFTDCYVKNHPSGNAPIVILHFIANTLLTNIDYNEFISGKRPNLASYVRAFTDEAKGDVLACLGQRVKQQRGKAMEAIDIAVATGLLAWQTKTAMLFPLPSLKIKRGSALKGISVQKIGAKADTLGKWLSELEVSTTTSSLGIIL